MAGSSSSTDGRRPTAARRRGATRPAAKKLSPLLALVSADVSNRRTRSRHRDRSRRQSTRRELPGDLRKPVRDAQARAVDDHQSEHEHTECQPPSSPAPRCQGTGMYHAGNSANVDRLEIAIGTASGATTWSGSAASAKAVSSSSSIPTSGSPITSATVVPGRTVATAATPRLAPYERLHDGSAVAVTKCTGSQSCLPRTGLGSARRGGERYGCMSGSWGLNSRRHPRRQGSVATGAGSDLEVVLITDPLVDEDSQRVVRLLPGGLHRPPPRRRPSSRARRCPRRPTRPHRDRLNHSPPRACLA